MRKPRLQKVHELLASVTLLLGGGHRACLFDASNHRSLQALEDCLRGVHPNPSPSHPPPCFPPLSLLSALPASAGSAVSSPRKGGPRPHRAGSASFHASVLHLNCVSSHHSHNTGRERIKTWGGTGRTGLMGNTAN